MRKHRTRRGFTLLEVLVASTIMAMAVATLLSAITSSLNNATRVTDSDRAAVMAQRLMDEILAGPPIQFGQVIEGAWDPRQYGWPSGIRAGWRARSEPFDRVPTAPLNETVERIVLEVWWMSGEQRRVFQLDGYRIAPLPGPGGPF